MKKYSSPYRESGLSAGDIVGTRIISKKEQKKRAKKGYIPESNIILKGIFDIDHNGNNEQTEMTKKVPGSLDKKVSDTTGLL